MVLEGYVGKDELYEIVTDKLTSLGITEERYPLDAFKLAEAYKEKLQIELRPFPSLSLGGLLYKDPDDQMSIMGINSLKSKKSQNFDVMHELCHYWFHPAGEHLCYDDKYIFQNKGIEWQANEGAAQALMPEKLFMQRYIYFNGDTDKLSDHFIVSKTAIEYRVKNLKLMPPVKLRGMLYKGKKDYHCRICGNMDFKYRDNYCKICGSMCYAFTHGYKWRAYSDGPDNVNRCPECGLFLDSNARYCTRCGSASTSFSLLSPWHEEVNIIEDTPICL